MIIAAFDLATITGCCDGAIGAAEPRVWSWFLTDQGSSRPERFRQLFTFLCNYFARQPCDAVVYEAPMPIASFKGMKGTNEETQTFLRGAVGVLELACQVAGKSVQPVRVQDARASVLGWRTNRGSGVTVRKRDGTFRDEGTKERVIRETKLLGARVENDNEADAFVLWRYSCNVQNPRLAVASTPLFRDVQ